MCLFCVFIWGRYWEQIYETLETTNLGCFLLCVPNIIYKKVTFLTFYICSICLHNAVLH